MRARAATTMAVLLALLVGGTVSAFRQDLKLTYQWKKGAALKYRIVQKSTTALSGLPGGMGDLTIEQSSSQTLNSVVEDVAADGTATLRQTVEAIQMEMNSPMMTLSYDSTAPNAGGGPPNAILKDVFSQLIGQPYTLVVASTGEIKKVEGVSQIAEKMFKNVAEDPMMAGMLNGLRANMSDDAIRSMLTQSFPQFPEKPLKIGDSWDVQASAANPMLGTLVTAIKATLKAVDGDGGGRVARIATTITIKRDASKPVPPNPMGMTLDVAEATGDGEQIFDVANGMLQSSTIHLTVPMTMTGTGPDGSALNMTSQVKSTTTTELVK